MGANRVQKKEKQQNKRNNFDDKHKSKHVRAKQALLAKQNNTIPNQNQQPNDANSKNKRKKQKQNR